jgi:hypothetical protein
MHKGMNALSRYHIDMRAHRKTDIQDDKQTEKLADIEAGNQTDRIAAGRQTDSKAASTPAERKANGEKEKHLDIKTDRYLNRQAETDRYKR